MERTVKYSNLDFAELNSVIGFKQSTFQKRIPLVETMRK